MEPLMSAGLYGGGLINVATPQMVSNYNRCLSALGLQQTTLESFSIDGSGWSVELANAFGKENYLASGNSNRYAIILTPEQRKAPIYAPFHSWERAALDEFKKKFEPHIAAITAISPLWVEIAPELSRIRTPHELLMLDSVRVVGHDLAGLKDVATKQRSLSEKFLDGTNWRDKNLRLELIEAGAPYGDLRTKAVVIPPMEFTDVRCFHTRLFGGVFVIRDIPGRDSMLVLEDPSIAGIECGEDIYSIDDMSLVDRLIKEGILELQLSALRKAGDAALASSLDDCKTSLSVDAYYDLASDPVPFDQLTAAHRKRFEDDHGDDPRIAAIDELEKLAVSLRGRKAIKELESTLSPLVTKLLLAPAGKIDSHVESVIKHLLVRMAPFDIERLYLYNKRRFYSAYMKWPLPKKEWAIRRLKGRGHPRPN